MIWPKACRGWDFELLYHAIDEHGGAAFEVVGIWAPKTCAEAALRVQLDTDQEQAIEPISSLDLRMA